VNTAWLIERTDVSLCYSRDTSQPCSKWVTLTDSNAWQFGDKASAERVITGRDLLNAVAVEHMWLRP
jgi:hypothetical protein